MKVLFSAIVFVLILLIFSQRHHPPAQGIGSPASDVSEDSPSTSTVSLDYSEYSNLALVAQGRPLKCFVVREGVLTTVYLKGDKIRSEVESEGVKSISIINEDALYTYDSDIGGWIRTTHASSGEKGLGIIFDRRGARKLLTELNCTVAELEDSLFTPPDDERIVDGVTAASGLRFPKVSELEGEKKDLTD